MQFLKAAAAAAVEQANIVADIAASEDEGGCCALFLHTLSSLRRRFVPSELLEAYE